MDFYLVPFANKVLEDNPDIDHHILPLLEEEMKRLNLLNKTSKTNNKKGKAKTSTSREKCVNTECKHNNTVDTSNKKAFGKCDVCSDLEHFNCAGTKLALRQDIAENVAKFICSICLSNNPLIGKELLMTQDSQNASEMLAIEYKETENLELEVVFRSA